MVKWLLEKDVFDEGLDDLYNSISEKGMEVKRIQYVPFDHKKSYSVFSDEDCVIFYGSLNLAKVIQREVPWVPGVYYNVDNFKCSTYYNYFGKYHINGDYMMLPFKDLNRMKDFLFSILGINDSIFIRPDSGSKQFTGKVVNLEDWDRDMNLLGFYNIPDNEIVVISSPKNIIDEYRFVVIGDEIIAGSHYNHNGKHTEERIDASSNHKSICYAKTVLSDVKWRPDKVFVLDVCKTNSGYHILEIGCFSCAGMYKCDKNIIVERVSEIALKEWNEYNDIEG